jgi:hypothetical protein
MPVRNLAKLTTALAAVLVAALGAAWLYTTRADPEVAFWREALGVKVARAEEIAGADRRVFFVGGSSCAFSIDPEQLEREFGINACNFGVHAGAGRALQIELALQHLRAGDILVVAFETPLWEGEGELAPEPLGSKLWYGVLSGRTYQRSRLPDAGFPDGYSAVQLRPGGYHCVTMLAKLLLGRPLYRYTSSDLRSGGFMSTGLREGELQPSESAVPYRLGSTGRSILQRLTEHAKSVGAQVVVTLPWSFVAEPAVAEQRQANQALANEIAEFCPVLADPNLGARSDPSDFSDTNWHLSAQGAAARTAVVGKALAGVMERGDRPGQE